MIIIIIGIKLETFTDKNQISLSYSQLTLLWDVEWTSCPAWKWKWERDSSNVRASSFWASGGLEPAFILDFGLPVGLGSGKFASDRLLVGLGLFCFYATTTVVKFAFETFQVWTESSAVGACQLVDRLKSILTSIFAVHNTLQRWCQSSQGEIFNEL